MMTKLLKSFFLSVLISIAILYPLIWSHPTLDEDQGSIDNEFSLCIAVNPKAFLTIWNTSNTSWDSSAMNQIRLPLRSNGTYNFVVDWGDGNNDTITKWNQTASTHSYISPGVYNINITGTIIGWSFKNSGDRLKLLEIQQWGCLRLINSGGNFYGCSKLNLTTNDSLNLTGITNMQGFFKQCSNLGNSGNINNWNVSEVIHMKELFYGANSFNQPLDNWNVSNVTDMSYMFYHADSFNQSIANWDISKIGEMESMFCLATSFNQPIGNWNVSSVTNMKDLFSYAYSFNQPIDSWDVSNVEYMLNMFNDAKSFNQPIDNWDVSRVTDMRSMFSDASAFDQPIGAWDVSSVRDMSYMFFQSTSFNQPIGNWNVSNVGSMVGMFSGAISFNQPITNWDVSNVERMMGMFFYATSFNQPIGNWDVSSVTDMTLMFYNATSFNQPLGNWDVSSVTKMSLMFYGISLSTANYDDLLIGWSKLSLQHGVEFHAGNSQCSLAGIFARETLINTFGWTIIDGGTDQSLQQALVMTALISSAVVLSLIIYIIIKKRKIG